MSKYLRRLRERVGPDLLLLPGVAALIRNEQGSLLLHQRPDESWSLPAGAIEPGETPAQAVVREVREETGFVARPVSLAGVFGGTAAQASYSNGDLVEYTVILFECKLEGGTERDAGDETVALKYCSPDEAQRLLDFPYPRHLLDSPAKAAYFQAEPSDDAG